MSNVMIAIVALLAGGVALLFLLRPAGTVPGAGALDAWGDPNANRAPPPDAPNDELGTQIAKTIGEGLKLANTWFSQKS